MLDSDSKTCGYRLLNPLTSSETTFPTHNSYGLPLTRASRSGGNSLILVPTIRDLIALLHTRIPGHVACLPYGLTTLPQTLLPALERFNKITLWINDDSGPPRNTLRNLAHKLNDKRCYAVRQDEPTPSNSSPEEIRRIVRSVVPVRHDSITTFANFRQEVFYELKNIEKSEGVKWKRFPHLTKVLKGHRRGELTVLTGPTGCGKTTFASEYSLDLAEQGVNTLWGSFEIRNSRLARTMLQQLSGCDLSENLSRFDEFADKFEQLPIYFMAFHGQQPIKVVMEAVEHAAYVHDIAHVVIDNVQFMMGVGDKNDRFWAQDQVVAAFRTFATRTDCHVTLVMHPRKERDSEELSVSSIFGGAKASQEADNVLIIQDKRLVSVRGKKYLQVVKNRYTGDLGVVPMDFDKTKLSYAYKKKGKGTQDLLQSTKEVTSNVDVIVT